MQASKTIVAINKDPEARNSCRPAAWAVKLRPDGSTVSAHLACLRDYGLVDVRPACRASASSLSQPALLAAAEAVLAANGNAVALCPR